MLFPTAALHAEPLLEVKPLVYSWPGESLLFKDLLEDTPAKFSLPAAVLEHVVFTGKEVSTEPSTHSSSDISKRLRRPLTSSNSLTQGVQFRLPLETEVKPDGSKFLESRMTSEIIQKLQEGCSCKVELSAFQLQWPENISAQTRWTWEKLPDVRFLRGNLFLGVNLEVKGQQHRRWVQARSRVMQKVPVATRPISYGEPFTDLNVTEEWRDVSHVSPDVLLQNQLAGYSSNRVIPLGQMIRRRDMAKSQVIRHGDLVRVYNRKGSLEVTASGVAQQAGAIGDAIQVKIASTNKTVSALIEGSGKVRIQ